MNDKNIKVLNLKDSRIESKIDWVDIFKGIAITLMVAGHAGSPINIYIYLFHMPAFIFISGYTYNGQKYTFLEYLKRKIKSILLPMIIINIIYILFYDLSARIGIYEYLQPNAPVSLAERLNIFFRHLGTVDLGGATWFLMVLFTIEILFKLISDLSGKFRIFLGNIIGSCIMAIIGWRYITAGVPLPYLIDLSLLGCIFFAIGVIVKKHAILSRYIDKKVMIPFSIIVIIFLGSFYFATQLPMNWPTRQFAIFPINLIGSICGIYLCYILSKILEQSEAFKKVFICIGQHTYFILVGHFLIFKLIFGIGILIGIYPVEYLRELVPKYSAGLQWIIITVSTIVISMLISFIAEKNKILNYIFNARLMNKKEKIINV